MEVQRECRPVTAVLAEAAALLDSIAPDRRTLGDTQRLQALASARRLTGRLQALTALLAAEAHDTGAAERAVHLPLSSWLAVSQRATRREATGLIRHGRRLTDLPMVKDAALNGRIGNAQTQAIANTLADLPDDLSTPQRERAEELMIGYATEFDAVGLARLSRRLVEVIDPDGADARDERALERQLRQAHARRHLDFLDDGHGSTTIRGSLPSLDLAPFVKLIDAYADEARRNALEHPDTHRPPRVAGVAAESDAARRTTPGMRRADALVALAARHQRAALAPATGGDRPRIVVTLDYDKLRQRCIDARLLDTDARLTAGQLRQLACDADLLPVVMGGPSDVLDVGRTQRLVTPAIRTALSLRDTGCVFPGCHTPAHACHAHHVVPWWAGGATALSNLVLLCPHHHGLLEPARSGDPRDQWRIHMTPDGEPQVIPPDGLPAGLSPPRRE